MTQEQRQAILAVAEALLEACKVAGPMGAPGGVLYAAAMSRMNIDTFQQFMAGLEAAKKVRKVGQCYVAI